MVSTSMTLNDHEPYTVGDFGDFWQFSVSVNISLVNFAEIGWR